MHKASFEDILEDFTRKRIKIFYENMELKNPQLNEIKQTQQDRFSKILSKIDANDEELRGLLREYVENIETAFSITNMAAYKQGVIDGIWLLEQYTP